MANTDVELEQQLKEVGKKLLHQPDAVDELLPVLDQVERLLSKVDQSPKKTMLDALKPSMKALIQDDLLRHSDVDVKVAAASCISEITRITAPDAPYDDDQMRDVFQLIVSSFEDLADQSSRSYIRRASILETVSKVRSCVIMLDLECDEMIVEMFEHFLRSLKGNIIVEFINPSMENIMILALEESEDISVEILKPLLATVKKHNEGVLPIAQKLGEDVLKKSAEKLKPYLMPALTALGDLLDTYSEIVTRVMIAKFPQLHKIMWNLVDKEEPVSRREPSVDQESSKQADEDEKQQLPNATSKEDIDDSDTDDKLAKSESKPEPTPKNGEKKSDTNIDSAEPSDSSHIEGEKEAEKLDLRHLAIESKSATANVSSPSQSDSLPDASRIKKAVRSKRKQVPQQDEIDTENAASPSKSETPLDESRLKKAGRSKNKDLDQEENTPLVDVKAPEISSDSDVKPQKRAGKMAVVAKEVKSPATIDSSEDDEAASDSDEEPPLKISKKLEHVNSGRKSKQSGKKAVVTKEVKLPDTIDSSEYDEAASDSDEEPPLKVSKKLEPVNLGSKSKQSGKMAVVTKEVKAPATIDSSEDEEAAGSSDDELLPKISKKLEPVNSGSKSKQPGKKVGAGDSDAKQAKQSVKKSDAKKPKQTGKTSKQSAKKEEDSVSDSEPLKSVKKVEKRKRIVEEEDSDSDAKPLKLSAKKGNASTSGDVKSSSKKKDDGRKRASGKNVIKKAEAKTLSSDDEMDVSPKSAKKPAKGEGNLKDTFRHSSKAAYTDEIAEFESEEAFPEVHKKKKSKADPAPSASQENNKDSSKKLKASGSKDNKSKAGKSKEAEVTPKTSY
ncbi:armadillo-type fold protein [Tanacetum coccineum]|uniref:Armadillo-type fold protein n=1 Tax=Tanacetum coccineum TaxID=301880 RepID=A0ABQ5GRU7_9ASTR